MIVTMYRRKWKFSVMSAEDAEDFIRQPHFDLWCWRIKIRSCVRCCYENSMQR